MPPLPCLAHPTSLVDEHVGLQVAVASCSRNKLSDSGQGRYGAVGSGQPTTYLTLCARLCLLLSFSTTSILTVVDLRSRLRLMVKSGLHMTTHLLQVPHSALTCLCHCCCRWSSLAQYCTQLGDSAWTSPAGLHVLSKAPPRRDPDRFSNQALNRYARDTTDAVDEESRSVAIYFDKLLSEWFLTVSFGPLRTIPAVDFWRMENGEWRRVHHFNIPTRYMEYRESVESATWQLLTLLVRAYSERDVHTSKLQNPPLEKAQKSRFSTVLHGIQVTYL
ncbi:unnamed protein product [Fusarium graminearum]|uniref:Chromosome 3, complete genome n=1 Tax=Gibberella zeae (strain ATCC MYA-4620 / CBS 123657 / FGSC 9075 / NRRL 31084 / PH-1) TaxID=229533 RepID=A0A098DZA6_GIBZE|nr:unnamed protein product [Fusarium graminearum]CZS84217.1 unnamed protein product [Fusarium graminearum]